jgi:hypothetical protein
MEFISSVLQLYYKKLISKASLAPRDRGLLFLAEVKEPNGNPKFIGHVFYNVHLKPFLCYGKDEGKAPMLMTVVGLAVAG